MITIHARNVSEAWAIFHRQIDLDTAVRPVAPRGVRTLEFREPVATVYRCPAECVLLDPVRDANPFFHLYEALWILAGFNDVSRVAYYSKQIAEYSDDATVFHGAYGHRMRFAYGVDQIEAVVDTLSRDPLSRRAVIGLWSPTLDIAQEQSGTAKDIPCNTTIYCKLRDGALHITVCNRSNDAVWGCYGANAVQFSFLQQYIAARLGVAIGTYTQISDSLHVYLDGKAGEVWERCRIGRPPLLQDYSPAAMGVDYTPLVAIDAERFLAETRMLLADPSGKSVTVDCAEPFLKYVVMPLLIVHECYREVSAREAWAMMLTLFQREQNDPWVVACSRWLKRRFK